MRLGEIRNIINKSISDDGTIVVDATAIYAGQAYSIKHFNSLADTLLTLKDQPWNNFDISDVETTLTNHRRSISLQVSADTYQLIESYVASLNTKLPFFSSILESITEDQDEHVINIKLPDAAKSFKTLNTINTNLEKLFKEAKVAGDIQVVGFDKGSDWYEVLLTAYSTYNLFIAALKIAKEFFKTRKEYYNSEKAKGDYEASLKVTGGEFKDDDLEKYTEARLDIGINQQAEEVANAIQDKNGHEDGELIAKVVAVSKELIQQMGDGVEFHLSLNPPAYADEEGGNLTIDYTKIREINERDAKKQKELDEPKSKQSNTPKAEQ